MMYLGIKFVAIGVFESKDELDTFVGEGPGEVDVSTSSVKLSVTTVGTFVLRLECMENLIFKDTR